MLAHVVKGKQKKEEDDDDDNDSMGIDFYFNRLLTVSVGWTLKRPHLNRLLW